MERRNGEENLTHHAVRMLKDKVQLLWGSSHHTEISEVRMTGSHRSCNLQVWIRAGKGHKGYGQEHSAAIQYQ